MCPARALDGPETVAKPFAGLTPQEVSAGLRRGNEDPSFALIVPRAQETPCAFALIDREAGLTRCCATVRSCSDWSGCHLSEPSSSCELSPPRLPSACMRQKQDPVAAFRRTKLLLNSDLTTAMSTDPPPALAPLLSSPRYSTRVSGNKKRPPCWARRNSARFSCFQPRHADGRRAGADREALRTRPQTLRPASRVSLLPCASGTAPSCGGSPRTRGRGGERAERPGPVFAGVTAQPCCMSRRSVAMSRSRPASHRGEPEGSAIQSGSCSSGTT